VRNDRHAPKSCLHCLQHSSLSISSIDIVNRIFVLNLQVDIIARSSFKDAIPVFFWSELFISYFVTIHKQWIILPYSGVAWHTPVRTCVRLKIEIQNLDKAKKLKGAIKNLRQMGVSGKFMQVCVSFKQYTWFSVWLLLCFYYFVQNTLFVTTFSNSFFEFFI